MGAMMQVLMQWLGSDGQLAAYRKVEVERPDDDCSIHRAVGSVRQIASADIVYVDGVMVKNRFGSRPLAATAG